jgi:hypothetical protein
MRELREPRSGIPTELQAHLDEYAVRHSRRGNRQAEFVASA